VLSSRGDDNEDFGAFLVRERENRTRHHSSTAQVHAAICEDPGMAGRFRKFRPTPWALTVAAWDIYRRLPPQQRRQLMKLARKHGPKLAARAAKAASRRR
jgi:hypothetical protein